MPTLPTDILLYTGHLTDPPDRPDERFPERKAKSVRRHIDAHLDVWRAGPGWRAIGGAARGADLLFVEACLDRGMEVALHLGLPPETFVARSVAGGAPEAGWERRFARALERCARQGTVAVMPDSFARPDEHVFAAANRWMLETAMRSASRSRVRVMAVWDEQPDTGAAGGTADFLEHAKRTASEAGRTPERDTYAVVNPTTLEEDLFAERSRRLKPGGPKRILALDGGGIRGALSLGILERIERLLRERTGNPALVLRDYFDLIGGTSTGAILATGLAIGMSTEQLVALYSELGPAIFGRRNWFIRRLRAKFPHRGLGEALAKHLGDRRLDDPLIPCGLCIVAKRADSRSTWPLHNHPNGRYFDRNGDILLRTAVRASTAAPTFFEPERVDYQFKPDGMPESGAFVDGGVSMANNPALQLFMVASLKGFRFNWPSGEDQLLLVSIGTGAWDPAKDEMDTDRRLKHVLRGRHWFHRLIGGPAVWDWAVQVPSMLMDDARDQAQLMLQWLSNSPTRVKIDSEVGDLKGELLTGRAELTYLRYNAPLTVEGLTEVGLSLRQSEVDPLRRLDRPDTVASLLDIGRRAAERDVAEVHFPPVFDVVQPARAVTASTGP